MNYDLSVIIPARNEEWLKRTVEDVLAKKKGNTEVIVILDGAWANPPLEDHKDLTVIYHAENIGQRAAINEGAKLSQAKFIMKLDAHCIVDEGFDLKLMADCEYTWTVIPRMYNLHAFDWVCEKCKFRKYQGPTPSLCEKCGGKMARDIIWLPRWHKRSDFMRFDSDLHFQYWGGFKERKEAQGDIADTMSFVGACWFLHRKRYWELGGSEESFGSWGQQGTEWACKTWLSGGRVVVNKKTWFSHLFRTQGGDFGFPYPQSGRQVDNARKKSKDFFVKGEWKGAIHPLSWLIEKFAPIPGWESSPWNKKLGVPTKGIIYYTDNQLMMKIARACRKQMLRAGLPIVSTSLKPLDFGKNIRMRMERGYEAYFKQILTALENSDSDIIYLCEHDWLYHPSHFWFTPPSKDTFYYNWNWWRVRSTDGHAVHYDTQMVPGLCAYRELLIEYYRQVVEYLTKVGFTSDNAHKIGFEPGTHKRVDFVGNYKVERFDSDFPIIDIRHTSNLTSSKWTPDAFRNQKNCQGWVENDGEIPCWGRIYGRFFEFLGEL